MADRLDAPGGPPRTHRDWPVFRSLAGYQADFLTRDLVAGLTLAAIAIPEQMATARLGGFAPQIGLFVLVAAAVAFAMFGASRVLSCGADSTITPIFAGALATMAAAGSADYFVLAAVLAIMVGILLVAAGSFRLGFIADLLSVPVTTGFLAGIAVHIVVSQLPSILGLAAPDGAMLRKIALIAAQLGAANPFTLAIGVGVLAIILLSEKLDGRIPGALIGLVGATLAVVMMGLESRGVAVLGEVSAAWPAPAIPAVSLAQLRGLVPLALIISITVMVQTAATTRSFPSVPGEPPDVDRDFIGIGAGNLLCGAFGAFPMNASPPRSAIVAESGGRSQIAGVAAAVITIALLGLGATLLRHVPQAALGGVLLFVALRIFRLRQIVDVCRQSFGEFLLIATTAAAIVVLPIAQGVGVGIALSLLHGIWSTTRARLVAFERVPGTTIWWPQSPQLRGETEPGILVAGLQAPLSFLNADRFRLDVKEALRSSPQPVRLFVLEATGIVEIDFTAAQALRGLIHDCEAMGVMFAIARLESARAQEALDRFHIHDVLHPDHLYRSVAEAIRAHDSTTTWTGQV